MDKARLVENSWSGIFILDQIHHRMHNHIPDEVTLANGQKFNLLSLALLGTPSLLGPLINYPESLLTLGLTVLIFCA